MSIFTEEYSFDNFAVNSGNVVAYTCALEIAKSPGSNKHNPLYIYGKTGTGKTHLMKAIGLYIQKHNPEMKVCYLSAEEFAMEVVEALRNKRMEELEKKYREIDVLMIDYVHYISGREETMEEFFRLFNILYSNNKQIIMASDLEPQKIHNLEERIYSIFKRGLILKIEKREDLL